MKIYQPSLILFLFLLLTSFLSSCKTETIETGFVDSTFSEVPKNKFTTFEYYFHNKDSLTFADSLVIDSLRSVFPLISDTHLKNITAKKYLKTENEIIQIDSLTADTNLIYKVEFDVPNNFLVDSTKLLWELNIAEYKSRIYQLHEGDTILINTWNSVVGKASEKTYTGYFEAYRIRNWPSWTNPDKNEFGEHDPPVPPGPGNPLGLFVVHYDKNSLRYFHGTNSPWVLNAKFRNVSKGCVRNGNKNIANMKEFIIRKIIKSDTLENWLDKDKRRSMTYDMKEGDKFPVRIIYKTYRIGHEEGSGPYFEKYRDFYGYRKWNFSRDRLNDSTLVTLTTKENILNELNNNFTYSLPNEKLDQIIEFLIDKADSYERYYFRNLARRFEVDISDFYN